MIVGLCPMDERLDGISGDPSRERNFPQRPLTPKLVRDQGQIHPRVSSDTQVYEIRRQPALRVARAVGRSGGADRKSLRAPGSPGGLRDDQA
jgi:hypothetical protein